MIQNVSIRLLEGIQQENLSRNHVIYYDDQYGWVYRQRDDAFNSFASTTNRNDTHIAPTDDARPLENLGPFGTRPTKIALTVTNNVDIYQTKVDRNLKRFDLVDGYGQRGPIASVTLTGQARDVAHIPRDATHFCWIYPLAGLTQLTRAQKVEMENEIIQGNLEYTFLALGGFAYFRLEQSSYKLLQTNCLVQANNGLIFQGPFQWNPTYTTHLQKQGRFQIATISTLLEFGIQYYCFINPGEKLKSSKNDEDWIPAPNGGFIYLYHSQLEPHPYDRYFCISDKALSEQLSTHVMPFSLVQKHNPSSMPSINKSPPNASISSPTNLNDRFLCSICLERTIRCIFVPCKHMCTCNECAMEIQNRRASTCPICRQNFREIWNVFM